MMAMLFIAEQRVAYQPGLALLTPRDIVESLKETLPHKPEGRDTLVARINRRRSVVGPRFRSQRKVAMSMNIGPLVLMNSGPSPGGDQTC